jgi:phage N-6-adenine-methyltransferase
MAVPQQNPGRSKQDYGTPPEFIKACKDRFGDLFVDLAATSENTVCNSWIPPEIDSLKQDWVCAYQYERCWLNPPYSNIEPWAAKCADYAKRSRGEILFLVPASIGSNWFVKHAKDCSVVIALNGRLSFVGTDGPYPKDLILCVYSRGLTGFQTWDWRKNDN